MFYLRPFLALLMCFPTLALAWEEQQALEFILTHNPVLQAQHALTREHVPQKTWERILERTSVFARVSTDSGTQLQPEDGFLTTGTTAGIQINIPLGSRKPAQEHAQKTLEEVKAIDQVHGKALEIMEQLRQHEADLAEAETRLKFCKDKLGWTEQRVKEGHDEVEKLWDAGEKHNEEQAKIEKLTRLIASQRHKLAMYAGDGWRGLLGYLEGKAAQLE
jgi:hypothetical protein